MNTVRYCTCITTDLVNFTKYERLLTAHAIIRKSLTELISNNEKYCLWIFLFLEKNDK